jgi:uncharacterized protein (TIGR03083 family)
MTNQGDRTGNQRANRAGDELDFLAHLRDESAHFLGVLRSGDLSRPVPTCPGWTGADLLWHLGEVQWFWGSIVRDRLPSPDGLDRPERPDGDHGLVQFFEEQSARLLLALTDADPSEEVYMWAEDKTVGYIRRRQAHEALIHRLDAELTTGAEVSPLDAALASDGLQEVLDVMYGGCPPWGTFTRQGPHLHVLAEDTGLVVPVVLGRFTGTDPDSGEAVDDAELSVQAADPREAPAAVVRGRAEDLDAWAWHRRDDSALAVEGDRAAYDRLLAVIAAPVD